MRGRAGEAGSRRIRRCRSGRCPRDLVRAGSVSAIEGEHQYTFTPMLIRDVAYDLLPRPRRRERHEQCALFLEAATAEIGEAGAALARHWRDAGDRARALQYAFV